MFVCEHCNKTFNREGWYKRHVCKKTDTAKPISVSSEFLCEYCNKSFKKEGSLQNHSCKQKERTLQKNDQNVVAGFMAFNYWYKIAMNAKKDKEFDSFISSQYYSAFTTFGTYIVNSKITEWQQYITWLVKNNIKIKEWSKDEIVNNFYTNLNKIETPDRAVEKFVITADSWSKNTGIHWAEFWEKANPYTIIEFVKQGKISPWILFSSDKAQQFIEKLPDELLPELITGIDVEYWKSKIAKSKKDTEWINSILQ